MAATSESRSSILRLFPTFYPIVDTDHLDRGNSSVEWTVEKLVASRVGIAQYRHKRPFTRSRFAQVRWVAETFRKAGICFIVNDRADIAMAVGADGVHVGQEDLPPEAVRRVVGPDMILGYSTHNMAQLEDDQCQWADYIAIGPVFTTESKARADPVVGLKGVEMATSIVRKPLVAIGGITEHNAEEAIDAGASSLAMISGYSPEDFPWGKPS